MPAGIGIPKQLLVALKKKQAVEQGHTRSRQRQVRRKPSVTRPRTGEDPQPPELAEPERLMAAKYFAPPTPPTAPASTAEPEMVHDGRHAWLRITPLKMVSWDFRKLASLPGRS